MNLKFLVLLSATASVLVSAAPRPLVVKRAVDESLVPDFGHQSGINPDSAGNCDGIKNSNGQVVRIPCGCPPPRDKFIASLNTNVDLKHAEHNPSVNVSFPSGNDQPSKRERMMAAIVTLQNLDGLGKGCPAASTTFSAQLDAILKGTSSSPAPPVPSSSDTLPSSVLPPVGAQAPPSSSSARPPQPSPAPDSSSDIVDRNLVPEFGHEAGLNPTGSGDCDGINNAAGVPIKVPCGCPPDREVFIQSLIANVAATHAVNNPSVSVSFPLGGDKHSKETRINAALVTLQNLNGPGKGCPAVSTTFNAQLKAIKDSPN